MGCDSIKKSKCRDFCMLRLSSASVVCSLIFKSFFFNLF